MSEILHSHDAMEDMADMAEDRIPEENYEHILFVAQPDDNEQSDVQNKHSFPSLQTEFNKCPETAFITQSNSNLRQRQQQSSDNDILLSFAINPRPPTFVVILELKTRTDFKFTNQIWSRQTSSRGPPGLFS